MRHCDAVDVKAHDALFRVWELAVSLLGLSLLPLVPRENTIAGELFNGERSGSLTGPATRDRLRCFTLRENTTASLNTAVGAEALDLDKEWMERSSLLETTS